MYLRLQALSEDEFLFWFLQENENVVGSVEQRLQEVNTSGSEHFSSKPSHIQLHTDGDNYLTITWCLDEYSKTQ
jgi:hypothetical protein